MLARWLGWSRGARMRQCFSGQRWRVSWRAGAGRKGELVLRRVVASIRRRQPDVYGKQAAVCHGSSGGMAAATAQHCSSAAEEVGLQARKHSWYRQQHLLDRPTRSREMQEALCWPVCCRRQAAGITAATSQHRSISSRRSTISHLAASADRQTPIERVQAPCCHPPAVCSVTQLAAADSASAAKLLTCLPPLPSSSCCRQGCCDCGRAPHHAACQAQPHGRPPSHPHSDLGA